MKTLKAGRWYFSIKGGVSYNFTWTSAQSQRCTVQWLKILPPPSPAFPCLALSKALSLHTQQDGQDGEYHKSISLEEALDALSSDVVHLLPGMCRPLLQGMAEAMHPAPRFKLLRCLLIQEEAVDVGLMLAHNGTQHPEGQEPLEAVQGKAERDRI